MSFCAGRTSGRAPPWSGHAPLEWSRVCVFAKENSAGVVAPHPGGRAPLWSGRAPSKAWKLLQIANFDQWIALACNFSPPNAQWNSSRREFAFIGSYLKKNLTQNPLCNVLTFAFSLTLFWSYFVLKLAFWCVWLRSFCRLTVWWTVVKEPGLLSALLQTFENFFIFTNFSWPWT